MCHQCTRGSCHPLKTAHTIVFKEGPKAYVSTCIFLRLTNVHQCASHICNPVRACDALSALPAAPDSHTKADSTLNTHSGWIEAEMDAACILRWVNAILQLATVYAYTYSLDEQPMHLPCPASCRLGSEWLVHFCRHA